MKISLQWLRDYLTVDVSAVDVADRLTMAGLEVESVEYLGEKYKNFVVGEVVEIRKHPKADKLTVCSVDMGTGLLQIVCGAPNVAPHQKVPVGLIDAIIPRNQHDSGDKSFRLSRVSIRGVESHGMICSEYELGLGEDREGILVLDKNAKLGCPLAEYFGLDDTIFEIGITPNRPDAMSHIGVARELGAILGREVKIPQPKIQESRRNISDFTRIIIDDNVNCPRYTARVILNVKTGPSPAWLQNRLKAIGVRPINNIVDATNYVLMECGHPLHAFDYDTLADHTVIVRTALQGENFITLDHKSRVLPSTTLMICDKERPIAIAGVMGGENSEISDHTRNILIESAYFNPGSIRKTSKYFGLSTDASQHFERGADPNVTSWAVNRAADLITKYAGGEILKGTIDVYPDKICGKIVGVNLGYANKFLDVNLTEADIIKILNRYHFKYLQSINSNSDTLIKFEIPTFRPDVEQEIDLIEEIARGFGYNNIEAKNETHITFSDEKVFADFNETLRKHAVSNGLTEIITNSMQSSDITSKYSDSYVRIINPISQEMSSLRTSLVPSVLEVIRHNIHHGLRDLQLFEIGKVYHHESGKRQNVFVPGYTEDERLIIALTGAQMPRFWNENTRSVDIFDLKGEVEILLAKIFLDNIKFIPYPTTDALTELGILLEINTVRAGYLGKIRKDILAGNDIEQDVFYAELEIPVLKDAQSREKHYLELPKFPPVTRDIAVVVGVDVPSEKIEEEIWHTGGKLLKSVELFDVFHGKQIGLQKKSYAYALVFMSDKQTLVQDEVELIINKISNSLQKSLNATIRKKEDVN